jgi:hypothetical protein
MKPTPAEVIESAICDEVTYPTIHAQALWVIHALEDEGYTIVDAAELRRIGAYLRLSAKSTEIASLVDELYALTNNAAVTTPLQSTESTPEPPESDFQGTSATPGTVKSSDGATERACAIVNQTVDDMLAWLKSREYRLGEAWYDGGGYWVTLSNLEHEPTYTAPTLHAALVAAVQAIDEREL